MALLVAYYATYLHITLRHCRPPLLRFIAFVMVVIYTGYLLPFSSYLPYLFGYYVTPLYICLHHIYAAELLYFIAATYLRHTFFPPAMPLFINMVIVWLFAAITILLLSFTSIFNIIILCCDDDAREDIIITLHF